MNRYVWWICEDKHVWKTKVYHRTDGRGCPYCAGLLAISGETDLGTVNPILAAEWNYPKNDGNGLTPQNVTSRSHKKIWWKCTCGYEWIASVTDRSAGRGCPVCAGRIRIPGVNDLATIFPELAKEWYYPNNHGKKPSDFAPYSNHYAWWQCEHGHIWKTKINNRANGTGCPYCNQNRLIPEKTSLAVINPVLAAQWHPVKNGERTPFNTSTYCNDKFWWRCEEGHEWDATVASRSYGNGCPRCNGRKRRKQKLI